MAKKKKKIDRYARLTTQTEMQYRYSQRGANPGNFKSKSGLTFKSKSASTLPKKSKSKSAALKIFKSNPNPGRFAKLVKSGFKSGFGFAHHWIQYSAVYTAGLL